jgi:23S rRNA (cytosine1962-C5)-methyltransferase
MTQDASIPLTIRRASRGALIARHPWVLRSSLQQVPTGLATGQAVELFDESGRWIAWGLYHQNSRIAVRVTSWDRQEPWGEALCLSRVDQALRLRRTLGEFHPQGAERLIFSEADLLGGVIIDRYADLLVVQQTAAVLSPWIGPIVERIERDLPVRGAWLRIDEKTAKAEGLEPGGRWLGADPGGGPRWIQEHDLQWRVDPQAGQKTGFYLDQRDNRREAARWVRPGDRVLDVCCYHGGFALTIAQHAQPSKIVAIDSSLAALEVAEENRRRNRMEQAPIEWLRGDFWELLDGARDRNERYQVIVLDPPRLAGSRDQMAAALRAYHRLNATAVGLLDPGGILVTCSCSGRVGRDMFEQMLLGVSKRTGRDLQILRRLGAAPDHPTLASCPETDYLKCFVCRVL